MTTHEISLILERLEGDEGDGGDGMVGLGYASADRKALEGDGDDYDNGDNYDENGIVYNNKKMRGDEIDKNYNDNDGDSGDDDNGNGNDDGENNDNISLPNLPYEPYESPPSSPSSSASSYDESNINRRSSTKSIILEKIESSEEEDPDSDSDDSIDEPESIIRKEKSDKISSILNNMNDSDELLWVQFMNLVCHSTKRSNGDISFEEKVCMHACMCR